jgi:hypothetical protein
LLEAAKAEARQKEAAQREQAARCSQLEEQVAKLAAQQQVGPLVRVTADLERERGDRRRIEERATSLAAQLQKLHEELGRNLELERSHQTRLGELERQLRERENAIAHLRADLEKEAANRELAEQHVSATGDLSAQLGKNLSLFEEAKKAFKRTKEEMEARLQAGLNALGESEAKLQKETAERQRLAEALDTAQRGLQEQVQARALELANLQSALEIERLERKRADGDALHHRYVSLDSARMGKTLLNSLRRELRQPVDNLMQSTCRLLEIELGAEQKKAIEGVLENALVLQRTLEEAENLDGGTDSIEGGAQAAEEESASGPAGHKRKPKKRSA